MMPTVPDKISAPNGVTVVSTVLTLVPRVKVSSILKMIHRFGVQSIEGCRGPT